MQTLKLEDSRMLKVLEGKKQQTVRLGKREIELGPLLLEATNKTTDNVVCDVYQVTYTRLKHVDLPEDYDTLDNFYNTMKSIYPEITPESLVTVIKFTKQ